MNRFNKRGLICATCGRSFNEHSNDQVCAECFEIAGYDNQVNDNGGEPLSASEARHIGQMLAQIAKKGGDVERAKEANDYIDWSSIVVSASRKVNKTKSSRATNGVAAPVRVIVGKKRTDYSSAVVAFKALGLPLNKLCEFRVTLKFNGTAAFHWKGVKYSFVAANKIV